jgi:hypothetical protein
MDHQSSTPTFFCVTSHFVVTFQEFELAEKSKFIELLFVSACQYALHMEDL